MTDNVAFERDVISVGAVAECVSARLKRDRLDGHSIGQVMNGIQALCPTKNQRGAGVSVGRVAIPVAIIRPECALRARPRMRGGRQAVLK